MKKISLGGKRYIIVDDSDYKKLSKFDWWFDGRYACREIKNKKVYLHRIILNYPSDEVDHINRNKLDNRKENLRSVTRSVNCLNKNAKGVSWHKPYKKWRARICVIGKEKFLGYFKTYNEARTVYLDYKSKLINYIPT